MSRMSESTFLSSDGKTQLYYREYLPEGEAVGIVQLVHGIAEHIARYNAFASFWRTTAISWWGTISLGTGKAH